MLLRAAAAMSAAAAAIAASACAVNMGEFFRFEIAHVVSPFAIPRGQPSEVCESY